jgi:hypothetical protein
MKKYLVLLQLPVEAVDSDSLGRAKDYAEEMLSGEKAGTTAYIFQHCLHAVKSGVVFSKSSPNAVKSKGSVNRQPVPAKNAQRVWSKDDDRLLRVAHDGGASDQEIADGLGRSPKAVAIRRGRLGL